MRIQSTAHALSALNQANQDPSEAVRRADPKNILRSGTIHPELSRKAEALIEKAAANGLDLYVFEGYRYLQSQTRAYARGASKAKPGNSFHNYGLAVDIVFKNARGQPSWDKSHDWKTLGRIGKESGLHWGGDFKDFFDGPHFQLLPSDEMTTVKKTYLESGLSGVWNQLAGR